MGKPLRFGSVCSGIEGASEAWYPLGMRCAWTSEIEPFPAAVIAERWGHKNYGDFRNIGADAEPIDLLVGGTPCQDFSVAGLRAGMAGDRGNLTLEFLRLAQRTRPRWVVWENVPGVLSSNNGRDFGIFLRGLGELGYGFAYRILDAQYFGVPQRRRRVFVVGYFGDWRVAAAVLFERHSLSGNPAPSRKAGERVAPCLSQSLRSSGGIGMSDQELFSQQGGGLTWPPEVAPTINAAFGSKLGLEDQHIDGGAGMFTMSSGQANAAIGRGEQIDSLTALHEAPILAATLVSEGDAHSGFRDEKGLVTAFTLPSAHRGVGNGHNTNYIPNAMAVRRLTPRECERLQGFPDDYTLIKFRGKLAADGPRYKALGNSWAVPVVRWIGSRILTSISESAETQDFRDTTK